MAKKQFEKVRMRKMKRSAFDLSYETKTTQNFGELNPVMVKEAVPGDQFSVNSEVMVRMAPTVFPIMHRVDVSVHHFFVPYRIIWNDWEDFIFPKKANSAPPSYPRVGVGPGNEETYTNVKTLWAKLGLPTMEKDSLSEDFWVNALPFRAYQAIYNEYFRDQNLEDEIDLDDDSDILNIRTRAWEKDYFTSAFPTAQKGPAVTMPLSGTNVAYKTTSELKTASGGEPATGPLTGSSVGDDQALLAAEGVFARLENIESFDGSATIEDLRRATRLQEWLERAMRGGTRYKEAIKSFFGMDIGDGRLDRPEYLGGGKQPISISEVLDTAGGDTPLGTMAGHGIAIGANNNFKHTAKEHGIYISLLSILPKTAYNQGVDRMWYRKDRFDYYWKEFANIGEQEILNEELFFDPSTPNVNSQTFGYQQRYAEYKYSQDQVTGDFRDTLNAWHLGRQFTSLPALNNTFIKPTDNDDLDRIFAVQSDDNDPFWIQVYNDIKARRPMPFFSNPSL